MATKKVKVPSSWNAKPVTRVGGGSGGVRKPSSPYSSVKRPLPSSERLPLTPKPKSTAKPAAKTKIELLREAAKTKPKSPAPRPKTKIELLREAAKTKPKSPAPRGTATPKPTAKPTTKPNSKTLASRGKAGISMPNSSRAGINLPRAAVNALPKPIGPTTKGMTPAAKPAVKRSAGVTANYQMLTNPTQNRGAGQRVTGGLAGGRAGKPSGDIARPAAKPTAATTAAAKSKLLGKGAVGTAIVGSILNAPEEIRKGFRLAKDPKGAVSDVVKGLGFTEGFLSMFDKKGGKSGSGTTSANSSGSRRTGQNSSNVQYPQGTPSSAGSRRGAAPVAGGGRSGGRTNTSVTTSATKLEKLFNPGGSRANYGLDKAPPAPELPAAVTRSSSSNSSSTPSRGSSTKSRSSSSSPSASTTSTSGTPAKPGQKWSDFNPGRGTSKTNNPLMKDMIKRMKDREDKEQASKAQQLTDKSRQNSGYSSAEKVDGSKYADEFKKKKGYNFSVS
jgi:hypothetical protein